MNSSPRLRVSCRRSRGSMPVPRAGRPSRGCWSSRRAVPSSRASTWYSSTPAPGGCHGAKPLLFRRFGRMRIAILDPAAGISGDMTLGALLTLGVPPSWLEALPGRLGFAGVGVVIRDAIRGGVNCKQVEFTIPEQPHGRHVGELVGLVERTPGADAGKEGAVRAFRLCGEGDGVGGPLEGAPTAPPGAALLRVLSAGAPPSRWRMVGSGWGAGQRDPKHYPNALRVIVAEQAAEAARVVQLASDMDDMSPEYV